MVYQCVKFDENRFKSMEIIAMSVIFFKSIKGDNLIALHYRVMPLGQNVALV